MLYAATKATMRKAFESSMVVDDIAATTKVLVLLLLRVRSMCVRVFMRILAIRSSIWQDVVLFSVCSVCVYY